MTKSTLEFTDNEDGSNEMKVIFERGFDKKSVAHQMANIVAKQLEEKYAQEIPRND